jgi:hypothetical protein
MGAKLTADPKVYGFELLSGGSPGIIVGSVSWEDFGQAMPFPAVWAQRSDLAAGRSPGSNP